MIWSASTAQQKRWFTLLVSCGGKKSELSLAGTSLIFAFGGMTKFGGTGTLMVSCLGCVDCTPAGDFFIWPVAVAVDSGKYFCTLLAVRPGQEENWLLLMALIHVDGEGLKAHWCKN